MEAVSRQDGGSGGFPYHDFFIFLKNMRGPGTRAAPWFAGDTPEPHFRGQSQTPEPGFRGHAETPEAHCRGSYPGSPLPGSELIFLDFDLALILSICSFNCTFSVTFFAI